MKTTYYEITAKPHTISDPDISFKITDLTHALIMADTLSSAFRGVDVISLETGEIMHSVYFSDSAFRPSMTQFEAVQIVISMISELKKNDEELQAYKDFRDYLYMLGSESMSEQDLNELYGTKVTIKHRDKSLDIPFDATLYNKLTDLIETIIKEY
jgi:hypothetical protein